MPYSETAWGGLSRVGVSASLVSTAAKEGNADFLLWLGYGRPQSAFWLSFEFGFGSFLGWAPSQHVALAVAPAASLRVGYDFLAIRLMSFVTTGYHSIFHGAYHGVTLEGFWKL